ncbi:acyl-coenzyme A synthetase ACSM5, mitochondrial-like [Crotalus tigris]|uniref:acyl-coenzyme A synthetase ACSM5, mitochondrial-like n=1 Tax=Crotalus tigris TaxID=88082 RepID=UPI00192F6BF6|nr:acyl-coenzyme A synthetase ACSM5, mitochondrial-like [Crotalus tigris]
MKVLVKCFGHLRSPWVFLQQAKRCLASLIPSYYEAVNRGEQEMPEYFNFASDVVDKWAQEEKDGKRAHNPAFWWVSSQDEEVKWSFKELAFLSRKAANVLTGPCGFQRGDKVMIVLPRIPEWWLLVLACMRTGIIFIPGTPQLTAKDISYRIQASRAKGIVVADQSVLAVDSITADCKLLKTKLVVSNISREGWLNFRDLLQAASGDHDCVKLRSEELMLIYFTSGSTGSPKMVEHSHCSYGIGFACSGRHWMNLSPSTVFWNTSDPGWVKTAWSNLFAPWIHGSCVFVHRLPQFEPTVILNTLVKYPITTFCTAPTAYRMLVQHNATSYKFRSLKHCVTGGEPLNPEVFEQWKVQTGLDIHEAYGQTETVTICANVQGMKIKPGSLGKASSPYDVQVVDDEGNIQPPGKEGNLAIRIKPKRPFCLFLRYSDAPEKTADTERGDFYITGDRAVKDEEDYFWFVGRADDIINSSGYRIGPFEVESALIEHPAVVESAVVSSPDPIRGEVVKAFIILSPAFLSHNPEALIQELQDHVKKSTAPYKYPRKIEFVQELPKTAAGKIQRSILRKQEWNQVKRQLDRPK